MDWIQKILQPTKNHIDIGSTENHHELKIQGMLDRPYFEAKTVCKILNILDYKNVLKNYVPKKYTKTLRELQESLKTTDFSPENPIVGKVYYKLSHKKGNELYIDVRGVKCLFNMSDFSECKAAADFSKELKNKLNIDVESEKFEHREILDVIKKSFPSLDFTEKYSHDSKVLIGLYSSSFGVLVVQRNFSGIPRKDIYKIKPEEDTEVIDFDPYTSFFDIFKVIGMISQKTIEKITQVD